MLKQLYLNDQLCDLIGDEEIEVDYAIFKIDDITTRNGLRSYEFKLPATATNKQILESPDQINNISTIPYNKMKARFLIDGVDTLVRFAEITSVKGAYNIRLYGANSDLFSSLKDLRLRDLDLSQFDHFWKFPSVVDSRTRGVSDCYIYPIVDMHTDLPQEIKYNNAIIVFSNISGPSQFDVGEIVRGSDSKAAGTVLQSQGSELILINISGGFIDDETIQGQQSGKNANADSVSVYNNTDIDNTNRIIRPNYLLPFFYVDYLLEQVMNQLNFDFTNEFASEPIYQTGTLVVSPAQIERNTDGSRYNARLSVLNGSIQTFQLFVLPSGVISSEGNYFNSTEAGNRTTSVFFADKVRVRIKLHVTIANDFASIPHVASFILRVYQETGFTDYTQSVTVPVTTYPNWPTYDLDFGVFDIERETATGNTYFEIYSIGTNPTGMSLENPPLAATQSYIDISEAEILEVYDTEYQTGILTDATISYLTLSNMLPDMSQADFVKAYVQMFFLLPVSDFINKSIRFIQFDKIYNNLANSYDWSDKIDFTEKPEIFFALDQYASINRFKYLDEESETKPTGTDGEINLSRDTVIPEDENVVELPYSASNEVLRLQDIPMNNVGLFDGGNFEGNKNPRILLLEKLNDTDLPGSGGVDYNDTVNSEVVTDNLPLTWFIRRGRALNLGFSDNLISLYYNTISNVLNNSKVVKVLVRLTASDISQLDFTRPVYISQYSSYFYISQIEAFSFTSNRSTVVELVKLNL